MSATQKCRYCGSPLRPCKCDRKAAKAAARSRLLGPKLAIPKVTHRSNHSAKEREEFARTYGSKERVEWTRRQPSVASGKGPCVNSHVSPGEGLPHGTGRKHDYKWIVPLTRDEERELHQIGQASFQAKYGIYLPGKAEEHHAAWGRYLKNGLESGFSGD